MPASQQIFELCHLQGCRRGAVPLSLPFSSCVHFQDSHRESLYPCFKSACLCVGGSGLVINNSLIALSDGCQLGDTNIKSVSCLGIFKRARNNRESGSYCRHSSRKYDTGE